MGMYTAFRARAFIKPGYRHLVRELLAADALGWNEETGRPHLDDKLDELAERHRFIRALAACPRAHCVFTWFNDCGPSACDWENEEEWRPHLTGDGYLVTQGCIKNYNSEWTKLAQVLDIIAHVDYCAQWYEEMYGGPQLYVGDGQWGPYPRDDSQDRGGWS